MKKLGTDADLSAVVEHYQTTLSLRQTAEHFGVHKNTIARRLQDAKDRGLLEAIARTKKTEIDQRYKDGERVLTSSGSVRSLSELLDAASVDLDKWAVSRHKVNKWDAQERGGGTVELYQVTAWLELRPQYLLERVEPEEPIQRVIRVEPPETSITLIVPDSQHGFRRREDGKLEPLHCRKSIDIVLQSAELLADSITDIILLGDMLDLAPFSKYPSTPDLRYTTQPAIVSLHWFLSELRRVCPSASIRYLAGNHESRINKAISENVDELLNLRPATDTKGHPVLSVEYLLGLDALDIEYVGPYGSTFFHHGVRFQHGSLVRRRGGQTSTAYLANATASGVWGHVHRLELAQRRIQTENGPKTITAMSPGCICRVDGAVPHAAGEPLDWQQGLGLMYRSGDSVSLQLIPIDQGVAVVHGTTIIGSDRVSEIKQATGLNI